jgi:hypothetical protein
MLFKKQFFWGYRYVFSDFKKCQKSAKKSGGVRQKGIFWEFIVILLISLLFSEKTG